MNVLDEIKISDKRKKRHRLVLCKKCRTKYTYRHFKGHVCKPKEE